MNLDNLDISSIEPVKNRTGLKIYLMKGTVIFKLYDTVVLSMNSKYMLLNSGGYRTAHTKNVINDNLPKGYLVYQKKGEWYVTTPTEVLLIE